MKYRPPWGPYQFDRTCAATICTLTASRGCSGEQVPDRKGGARRLPPAAERRRVGLRQRAERELPGVHQARSTSTVGQTCSEFHWNRSPAARPRHTFRLQLPTTIRGVACSSMVAACSLHREAVNTRVLLHVAQSTEDHRYEHPLDYLQRNPFFEKNTHLIIVKLST